MTDTDEPRDDVITTSSSVTSCGVCGEPLETFWSDLAEGYRIGFRLHLDTLDQPASDDTPHPFVCVSTSTRSGGPNAPVPSGYYCARCGELLEPVEHFDQLIHTETHLFNCSVKGAVVTPF